MTFILFKQIISQPMFDLFFRLSLLINLNYYLVQSPIHMIQSSNM